MRPPNKKDGKGKNGNGKDNNKKHKVTKDTYNRAAICFHLMLSRSVATSFMFV